MVTNFPEVIQVSLVPYMGNSWTMRGDGHTVYCFLCVCVCVCVYVRVCVCTSMCVVCVWYAELNCIVNLICPTKLDFVITIYWKWPVTDLYFDPWSLKWKDIRMFLDVLMLMYRWSRWLHMPVAHILQQRRSVLQSTWCKKWTTSYWARPLLDWSIHTRYALIIRTPAWIHMAMMSYCLFFFGNNHIL